MYELQATGDDGNQRIFRTDNEADFIRQVITGLIADFDVAAGVVAKVSDADAGWTRIGLTIARDPAQQHLKEFETSFDSIFGPRGKGYYDCREEARSADDSTNSYIVRHRDGAPWS